MRANINDIPSQGSAVEDAFDPSIFDRTSPNPSTPLRRVLDRRQMWNHRNQQSAYRLNLDDRVQRVLSAWQDEEPEFGAVLQMANDLAEISAMEVLGQVAADVQRPNPGTSIHPIYMITQYLFAVCIYMLTDV